MHKKCCKCGATFEYQEGDCYWDYRGSNYDTKLVKCDGCGAVNIVKYWFVPDRDSWYYEYDKGDMNG